MYYTYIIKCIGGSLYTGITTDVARRFSEHLSRSSLGAKYTRSHYVQSVEAVWSSDSRASASKLEYLIKSLPRTKKLTLIKCPDKINEYFDNLSATLYTYERELLLELQKKY